MAQEEIAMFRDEVAALSQKVSALSGLEASLIDRIAENENKFKDDLKQLQTAIDNISMSSVFG